MSDENQDDIINQTELERRLKVGDSLDGVKIGDVDFKGHIFKEKYSEPNFAGAIFTGQAIFRNARFLNGANFCVAQFFGNGGADFIGAEFSGDGRANFIGAQFSGDRGADFIAARFSGKGGANFARAQFFGNGGADFIGAEFSGVQGANFQRINFLNEGEIRFDGTGFGKDSLIDFSNVRIRHPRNVLFRDVYLGRTSFYRTDVEEIVFKNVEFRKSASGIERQILADEVWNDIAPANETRTYDRDYFRYVEILYRQLKRNFEEQRDYPGAGDFHYGEMEMKRRQAPRSLHKVVIYLYKWVSGYGEKWQLALRWFAAFLLVFTFLNPLWMDLGRQHPNYDAKSPVCGSSLDWCEEVSIPDAAFFTLNALTLRSDSYYRVKNHGLGKFMVAFQNFFGVTFIALMLLAIRRQFRR